MQALLEIIKEEAAFQRVQFFLWWPVFFAVGIIVYFALAIEPPAYLCMAAFMLAMGGVALSRGREWGVVFVTLLLICAGFGVAQLRTSIVYTPIIAKKIQPVEVRGIVREIENLGADGQRIVISEPEIEGLAPDKTPVYIRLKFRTAQDVKGGEYIQTLAGLIPPSPPIIPGGFDFQRYMFFDRIGATGFSFGDLEVLETHGLSVFNIDGLRHSIEGRIYALLGESSVAGVSAALMTGYRGGISEGDKEAMRGAGLAHMLAISGLHIGLFSGVAFFLVRLGFAAVSPHFALNYPIKKFAALAGIAAAVFYMFMAGASVPTQRAVLMSLVFYVAIMLDRFPLSMRLVVFAALCVLVIAPEALLSASFQMSFSAVAALVAFYEAVAPRMRALYAKGGVLRRIGFYIGGVCMTSLIAGLATAPFALFHFQALAVYGLLGNMLAMPILTFIVMPFAFLAYFLMPFGLDGWALAVVGQGVQWILQIAHSVSSMDGAVWHVRLWSVEVLLLLSAGFIGLLFLRRGRLVVGACAVMVASVMIIRAPLPFMLISQGSKLVAVHKDGALSFSALNTERFARENWMRSYGYDVEALRWPREGAEHGVTCGEFGCRVEAAGSVIFDVVQGAYAASQVCGQSDVVVIQDGIYDECAESIVIDRIDTYRGGAHALYVDAGRVRVVSSEERRGARPWSAKYQREIRR